MTMEATVSLKSQQTHNRETLTNNDYRECVTSQVAKTVDTGTDQEEWI